MSIRARTLILIAGTTVSLLAILYTISVLLFLGRFVALERREALRGLEQARNALANELDELDVFNHDWASWDDTFAFVQDGNPQYLESNLMDETFAGARLNLMLFLNRRGDLVFAKSYDWRRKQRLPVPVPLLQRLKPGDALVPRTDQEEHTGGLLLLPDAPLLVSSHPILTSTSRGPSRGTLIMGRYLDAEEVAELAEMTKLSLRVIRLDREQPEELPAAARSALSRQEEVVHALNARRVSAYALLRDVNGEAALVLCSTSAREIYRQGLTALRYLVFSLFGVGLVFCAAIMALLEGAVLRRLSGLSRGVAGVGSRRDLSARIAVSGNDELAGLGESINTMLAELQQAAETHRALTGAVPDLILRVDETGTLLDANRPDDPLLVPIASPGARQELKCRLPAALAERSLMELRAALTARAIRIFEHREELAGGSRDYEVRVVVIGSGEVLEIIRDVTERKQVEELAKKELLLREIHHRVKNNLQVVSSLLYLQSQQVGDPRLAGILDENRQRIRSIALIHEKLYQSAEPGEVRFADYLRDLANNLLIAYGASASHVRLELAVDEGEVLGLDTAILLGLLINELVSNALKHAFAGGAGGVIRIALEATSPENLRLEVSDNGTGLPLEFDPAASRSMGLMLVQLFARQLEAAMQIQRGGGTKFQFLFRRPR